MCIEDMTSLSVRPITKLGITHPKGAIPGDTEYANLSDDDYDSDNDEETCNDDGSDTEDDLYPETTSETSECDQVMSSKFPDYIRKRMNRSPTSIIFNSILQEEEFLPE